MKRSDEGEQQVQHEDDLDLVSCGHHDEPGTSNAASASDGPDRLQTLWSRLDTVQALLYMVIGHK